MMSRSSTPSVFVSGADNELNESLVSTQNEFTTNEAQQDLAQASSKNPSILLELDMDGNVKHLSKAWTSVVGTDVAKIVKRPISKIIMGTEEDKNVFVDAIRIMMTDDESYRVRFVVATNDTTPEVEESDDDEADLTTHEDMESSSSDQDSHSDQASLSSLSTNGDVIELEGQGILIHDQNNVPTHSMWVLKPFFANSLNVELPLRLAESLGFGAEIFSSYLQSLSEIGIINEDDCPAPPQVLCRICEQQVPSWWLERHSQLCFNEHKCESDVQLIHDALVEQKQTIATITEALSKQSLGLTDELPEYKELPLPKVAPAPDTSTPVAKSRRARSGSFMVTLRFPFKTLALLQELCDHAISINPSEFDETTKTFEFSPNTKDAFMHVQASKLPASSDAAINLLSTDTEALVQEKIDAVERFTSSLVYSQKIKDEVDGLVLSTIKETIKNIRNQTYEVRTSVDRTHSDSISSDNASERPHSTIVHPRPKAAQPSIFTDAYMDTDSIPSPGQHRSELSDSRDRFSPSRSITPGETVSKDNSFVNDVFNSFHDLHIKSPILTPQRKPSPGAPSGYHNSPMSSIQRNTRPYGFDSSSGTPISSPLILAHEGGDHMEKKSSAGENFLSVSSAGSGSKAPLSPLLVAVQPPKSSAEQSIKDYEILKPISKGAFGSVYLARRKVTGDYFAIKVLKRADMIAKNQVNNVKAERAIMMAQSDSPYVARLYSTFKGRDHLFLVMEYLPGGDCSTIIKLLGGLPDEWAKQYIAEVVVSVEDLHKRGIVHHDLKPDNLLIDSAGHLKLTDFGLSRMGLIRRQERVSKMPPSSVTEEVFGQPTTKLTHHARQRTDSISGMMLSTPDSISASSSPTTSFFDTLVRSEPRKNSGSGTQGQVLESPHIMPMRRSSSQSSFVLPDFETVSPSSSSGSKNLALFHPDNKSKNQKFVGTPDYLAPETIRGTGESEAVDWWSVGCILFEFLFGYPPFHAESPEKVFENILKGEIDWPKLTPEEEEAICPPDAKDLIKKLLTMDPEKRLGANGADEIKGHPYLKTINWDMVYKTEGSFVPSVEDPESTEYFESRGAAMNDLPLGSSDEEDEAEAVPSQSTKAPLSVKTKLPQTNITTALGSPSTASSSNSPTQRHLSLAIPSHLRERRPSKLAENTSEFGSFQFRNLPALDKANKDVVNRIKAEHLEHRNSMSSSSSESGYARSRNYSISSPTAFKRSSSPSSLLRSQSPGRGSFSSQNVVHTPTSVTDEYSFYETSGKSSPSTDSGSPSTRLLGKPQTPTFGSRGSRASIFQRAMSDFSPSSSDTEDSKVSALQRIHKRRQSSKMSEGSSTRVQILDVLLCEPIPIMRYSLKKDLESLGCAVVAVTSVDELIRRATGEVKFDMILTALKMTKMSVIDIVKLLKHTSSVNSDTPIIALTAYYKEAVTSGYFTDVLEKPVEKKHLKAVLERHCRLKVSQAEEAVSDSESEVGSGSGSAAASGTLRASTPK